MELDVVAATPDAVEDEDQSEKEHDKNESGSVKISVWRSSKSHRRIYSLIVEYVYESTC